MLEPLVRANLHRWQRAYDYFPSPARHVVASARGWVLAQIRYAPETFELLQNLREHERWSPDQVRAYQIHALQMTLDLARDAVPFYRDYPAIRLREPSDLRQLPVLHRETVRQNQEQFVSAAIPASRLIRAGTTGTTGGNLHVAYTEEVARANWAFLLRQREWAGVRPRERRITLQGARIVPVRNAKPPFWVHNAAERQLLLSIFHLSEQTAPAYLSFLHAHEGVVLEGFPSALAILADFALARGEQIPMRVVFTSGEPLYPPIRDKIEGAFGSRVFDSYGMTELCGLIQECERGRMHLIPSYGFLEILDDNDEPCGPGEEGHLVWTSFINSAMPLIRYRIGDRGRWLSENTCPCGRSFPLVVPTITRESDLLHCPDGRVFSPRALNQLLKHSASLRFCQFIHERRERVVVRAVASNGDALEEMMQIRAGLQDLLGPRMEVIASLALEPFKSPGGKIPLIVNQMAAP
ncbi:MAG: phenylacetate--CoA ligase family protein [Candidatus Acidiferrales bacterium]